VSSKLHDRKPSGEKRKMFLACSCLTRAPPRPTNCAWARWIANYYLAPAWGKSLSAHVAVESAGISNGRITLSELTEGGSRPCIRPELSGIIARFRAANYRKEQLSGSSLDYLAGLNPRGIPPPTHYQGTCKAKKPCRAANPGFSKSSWLGWCGKNGRLARRFSGAANCQTRYHCFCF